jgi:hypothetical protein
MPTIDEVFAQHFETWHIRLPARDVAERRRGRIVCNGWAIWYLFGSDEQGQYLDYYAAHRMTSDAHVRIRPDGRCEHLPTLSSLRVASEDPIEDARLEAEFHAENQRVARLLEAKGFGLAGDEPLSISLQRVLLEHPDE